MNMTFLCGHLGKDGEMRYTGNGNAVLSFSIATSESWHDDKGEKKEKTEWHRCVAWRKLAEAISPHAKKGAAIMIIGKTTTRSYDDKSRKKVYITETIVEHAGIPFHKGKEGPGSDEQLSPREERRPPASNDQNSDSWDLPF